MKILYIILSIKIEKYFKYINNYMNNYMNNSLFFNDLDSDPDINTNNSCLFKNNYIIESDEIYKYLKPNIVNNETNYNIKKQDNVINGTKETKEKINREKHSQIELYQKVLLL